MNNTRSSKRQRKRPYRGAIGTSTGLIRAPAERKRNYTGYVAQTALITSGSYYISAIPLGDDYTDREGRAIRYLGMTMRLMISSVAATSQNNLGRWAIVLDRQPNGALATYSQVYDTSVGLGDAAVAPVNQANVERFRILSEHPYAITPVSGGHPCQYWDFRLDLERILQGRDAIQRFSNTTAAIASVSTNALLLVYAVSGQAGFGSSTNYAVLSFQNELEFQE